MRREICFDHLSNTVGIDMSFDIRDDYVVPERDLKRRLPKKCAYRDHASLVLHCGQATRKRREREACIGCGQCVQLGAATPSRVEMTAIAAVSGKLSGAPDSQLISDSVMLFYMYRLDIDAQLAHHFILNAHRWGCVLEVERGSKCQLVRLN